MTLQASYSPKPRNFEIFRDSLTRHHMLDADYLSAWFPKRAAERRAFLERIGKATPFWLGTPSPP